MDIRETFKSVFDNDYCGAEEFLPKVIVPIFGEKDVNIFKYAEENPTGADIDTLRKANIQEIYRVATIERVGTDPIEVFDITLGDSTDLSRARVGIQRIIRGALFPYSHAFILFHHRVLNCTEWRFSYVYKQDTTTHTTDAKRFTYLFSRDLHARTAIDRFCALAESDKSNDALLKAFNVEALSDDFFEKYLAQYVKFVKYISGKEYVKERGKYVEKVTGVPNEELYSAFGHDDKAVRDYVKKLMGRITFLHFLQRKGWMRHDMNYMLHLFEKSAYKDNFLDKVLEPLFFGVLNTRKENRASLFQQAGWDLNLLDEWQDIPYLNGGLFEQDPIDQYDSVFPQEYFSSLLNFFAEYNFTVDENDLDDAEVGVDPEMLGKIFENLLEDNKDKGTFYTPKEIVRYMCQESLISYLVNRTGYEEEKVRLFVLQPYDYESSFSDSEKNALYNCLENVKICDPAIGSGAFPMGLLNQLVRCEEALLGEKEDEHEGRAGLKKSIIKNNIYGVDIEKGAIDIARLRFWLSIVVDEENAEPLPNLDYKIMQGNSLLESYEGFDLSGLMSYDDKEEAEPLQNLWGEFENVEQNLTYKKKGSSKKLQENIVRYYSIEDHEEKKLLLEKIQSTVREQIVYNTDLHISACQRIVNETNERLVNRQNAVRKDLKAIARDQALLKKMEEDIQKYQGIKQRVSTLNVINDQFFLWHTWFSDVFNQNPECAEQNGFDIVIGNPPYGASIKGDYRNNVVNSLGKVPDFEIYYFFIEEAYHLARKSGIVNFIVPNTWLFNVYASNYRQKVLDTWHISEILDCSGFKIFNATVFNSIFIFYKTDPNQLVGYRPTLDCTSFQQLISRPRISMSKEDLLEQNYNWGLAFKLPQLAKTIVQKISSSSHVLSDYFPEISQGLIAYDKYQGTPEDVIERRAYHYSEYKEGLKEWLWGEDVKRYSVKWNEKEWIDYCDGIANPRQPKFFKGERLLVREITNPSIMAAIINEEAYNDPAVIIVLPSLDNSYSLKVVLAILNSELATFYHFNHSSKASKGAFPKILIIDVKDFPLPAVTKEQVKEIEKLVDERLTCTSDEKELDKRIDNKVYELYGLEPEEIHFIQEQFNRQ